jgi:hypothetical protein
MTEGVDVTNSAKLVPYMTEGVDVTNSAWDPIFFQVGEEGVDVTNSAWDPKFFQVGILHDGRG